jgi:ABC-2 type transport system ATP-binding protein
MGFVPWTQREKLAYHIGTVFGQRPQLWYHLPAIDTFTLFGKIYELEDHQATRRIGFLSEAFEIENILEIPVRKLSLGQRMRCEIAASMLHNPKLILLDEPSIGLDVVAKQRIRDTIRHVSESENVGVMVTSHDAGDLEALCKRVIIINHGQIVYQNSLSNLKRHYLTIKEVSVRYAQRLQTDFYFDGVNIIKIGSYGVKLQFDTKSISAETVLYRLAERGELVDITISDPSLEKIIGTIYKEVNKK